MRKQRFELCGVDRSVVDGSVFDSIEGYGPVHGTGVDEYITDPCCNLLGEGAFAAGREAVDGDNDFTFSRE